jgi:hypothetical protein
MIFVVSETVCVVSEAVVLVSEVALLVRRSVPLVIAATFQVSETRTMVTGTLLPVSNPPGAWH